MVGKSYLSELVNLETLKKDKLNIIKAPTGSGKTYFALTAIPASLTDAVHKVVYLIDTINGKEQILQNYNARSIYRHWEVEVKDEALYFEADERIVIITYAKFGILLEKYPDFHEHFEYIICDELHSLFKFERYSAQPNAHSIAHHGIERAVRNGYTKVIALSATPERIKREFDAPHCDVPVDDSNLIQYETRQIIPYTNLNYLLTSLDPTQTGICYVSRISTMKVIEADAHKLGLNPISVWSVRNSEHPMSEEQLQARQHVLNNFAILADYHLLIINASSETSLKINTPVDYVIVHSKKTIEMTKAFAKAASDPRSEEYALLQKVRNDYPAYSVVKRTIKHKKSQEHYAGLTYEYMENYIMNHVHSTMEERMKNLKDFNELRMIAMCHSKARAFPFIRSWFLDLFPEVEKFGVKVAKVEVEDEIEEEEEQLALPAPTEAIAS